MTQAPGIFQEKAPVPSILRLELSLCWGGGEERLPHTHGEEAALGGGSGQQDPRVSGGLWSPGSKWRRRPQRERELGGDVTSSHDSLHSSSRCPCDQHSVSPCLGACVCQVPSVMSDSSCPIGQQPARLLCMGRWVLHCERHLAKSPRPLLRCCRLLEDPSPKGRQWPWWESRPSQTLWAPR